jgi:hypothetical protein
MEEHHLGYRSGLKLTTPSVTVFVITACVFTSNGLYIIDDAFSIKTITMSSEIWRSWSRERLEGTAKTEWPNGTTRPCGAMQRTGPAQAVPAPPQSFPQSVALQYLFHGYGLFQPVKADECFVHDFGSPEKKEGGVPSGFSSLRVLMLSAFKKEEVRRMS